MLKNKSVMFEKPWEARLCEEDLDDSVIPAGNALIKKKYSIISTGTELACLSGNESWFKMPRVHGYSCVGEVIKIGENVTNVSPGDTVFCYGRHTLYQVLPVSGVFIRVPKEADLKWIPFVRMASIAATALRCSNIELGDYVVVTGQGMVGNMAMQLAKLQGARVIAVDIEDNRLEIAKKCGADLTINSSKQDAAALIKDFTKGLMASTLIEATGVPSICVSAIEWVAKNGEIIYLGSPRGNFETDVTPFLNRSHLADFHVTVKGAHEWIYPIAKNPFVKHSIERNTEIIIDFILSGKLIIEPLFTEIVTPADCVTIYKNLRDNKDKYMGVIFDWSK